MEILVVEKLDFVKEVLGGWEVCEVGVVQVTPPSLGGESRGGPRAGLGPVTPLWVRTVTVATSTIELPTTGCKFPPERRSDTQRAGELSLGGILLRVCLLIAVLVST
jgi:hypothetical protein